MDQVLLKRINIISIILVFLFIIVFAVVPLSGPLVLITALPLLYIFILFFLNIRKSVLDQVSVYKKADETLDAEKSPLGIIRYSLYIGILAVMVLSAALLWFMEPDSSIYGSLLIVILFLITFLYLARLIDLSYTAEYFSSKKVRINYGNIMIALALVVVLGVVVFIYMRYQIPWYIIGVTLLFLGVATYSRTRKTLNFLRYMKNKPVDPKMEEGLRIFNSLAFMILVIAYVFLPYLTLNVGSTAIKIAIFTTLLRVAVVVNLAKAILDIS